MSIWPGIEGKRKVKLQLGSLKGRSMLKTFQVNLEGFQLE